MKNHIFTIFKKEMLDMLRDRRTVITMIVMPILLMPIIISLSSYIASDRIKKAQAKDIKIAISANENGVDLVKRFKRQKDVQIIEGVNKKDFEELIRNDSLDLAIDISEDFDSRIENGKTAEVQVFFDSTDEGLFMKRLKNTIDNYKEFIVKSRLVLLGEEMNLIKPIKTSEQDVYTQTESLGKRIGGFLPYIFVIFCLMGAMYPAIDLFTGEKERGTMETILSVPASRLQILLGKMLVVVLSGVISGVLMIIGLYLALKLNPDVPGWVITMANELLSSQSLGLIILMLIPLTTFFAGILIPTSIYAKSFKEAQSLIQPLIIVVTIPLVIAMMPGFKLDAFTALIPILNVALATKEIVAGTINYGLLSLVFVSLFVFAGIGIAICVRWFGAERNILRT
ncbi:ABC transporter permease [Saprospiraceae bacterium]|jgi:sodium transport system permease protein|nr:ABC transporter permease [bacterium]MDB4414792.1 ABC transporter permease [bacterium]MDC3209878.1 ABC transporter permease [Saprospiraceae bacterium]MDG1434414.1 ABC transporter permease [Saprospiraceae bacterium]